MVEDWLIRQPATVNGAGIGGKSTIMNEKLKVVLQPVNLQEGFIVMKEFRQDYGGQIIAAYNHHHRIIATVAPWDVMDFDVPKCMEDYKVWNKAVGHFEIYGWTNIRGNKEAVSVSELMGILRDLWGY